MIDRAIPNLTRAGALTLLSLAIHCGDAPEPTDGVLCTAELRTAVRVFVRDEAGQPLRADSVFASFEGSPGGGRLHDRSRDAPRSAHLSPVGAPRAPRLADRGSSTL